MSQIMKFGNPEATMSSREIAEVVESRHDSVKRTIERLAADSLITFTPTVEPTLGGGKPTEVYHVNKRDSYVVVARLSPKFTARLVDRWQELENQQPVFQIPQTKAEALRLAADLAEQVEQQQVLIEAAKPAVEFVDRYVQATGNKGFRQTAKLFKANEKEFRQFLVKHKIMYKLGGEWVPYQSHIDAGRFVVKTGVAGNEHAYNTAKLTPKGVTWLAEKWNLYEGTVA